MSIHIATIQDPILKSENDLKNLTDDCGKVNRLNEHATILVPFYYLPLLISFLVIVKVMSTKVYTRWLVTIASSHVTINRLTTLSCILLQILAT